MLSYHTTTHPPAPHTNNSRHFIALRPVARMDAEHLGECMELHENEARVDAAAPESVCTSEHDMDDVEGGTPDQHNEIEGCSVSQPSAGDVDGAERFRPPKRKRVTLAESYQDQCKLWKVSGSFMQGYGDEIYLDDHAGTAPKW